MNNYQAVNAYTMQLMQAFPEQTNEAVEVRVD